MRKVLGLPTRFGGPLLLFLLVAAANYNIVFLGQTLVASSNYHPFDYRFTHLHLSPEDISFPIVNWHDAGVPWWQWEPAGKLFSKEFRAGRIPLWDPDIGGGVDAHVSVTQGQYYPPYILLLLAGDTPVLRDAYSLLEIFAAGLFCFFLLKNHGCHTLSAAAMGLAYMLGGSLTQTINSIEGQSYAVLPAMVWAMDRVLRTPSWRNAGIAALTLATATLSSFLPVVFSGYLLVGILVVVYAFGTSVFGTSGFKAVRSNARRWLPPVTAIVVSLMLTGFLLLPLRNAAHQDQVFSTMYPEAGLQASSVDHLLTLISPLVSFDVHQSFNPPISQLFQANGRPIFFYIGIVPVLLALLGLFRNDLQLRKLYLFFAVSTVFLLMKFLGMPPAQWIGYLPMWKNLHYTPYFCGALNFAVAGLAGLGIEELIRRNRLSTLAVAIIGVIAFFVGLARFAETQAINPVLQGGALWSAVMHYGVELIRIVLLAAGFLAVLLLRRRSLPGVMAAALMLVLVFLDLAPLGARSRHLRSDVWADPPEYVRFLQRDHSIFRIHSNKDLALTADTSQAFGLNVLSSRQSFNSTRYTELLRKYFAAPMLPYPLAITLVPSARTLLDVLNVKYLVLWSPKPEDIQKLTDSGFYLKSQDGWFQTFQNKNVWDRAYLARSARVAANPDESLKALADLKPGDAVVEQPVANLSPEPGTVQDLHYDFDTITMRVHAAAPGLLVLDENFSPGWHASVAGRPAGIVRANYSFQAVAVPQGDSRVEFHYVPSDLYWGIALTLLGFVATGAMLFSRT